MKPLFKKNLMHDLRYTLFPALEKEKEAKIKEEMEKEISHLKHQIAGYKGYAAKNKKK